MSVQATFDELGTPLREVTFVVVDLETTGGSPADADITEIGAVKVRSGELIGEFQTLVNPRRCIPPFIAVLTGITDTMVGCAPTLDAVLPTFVDWIGRDSVLVAHNAPFDVGFLRAGAERLDLPWPEFATLDTARLARRVLTRDESPDCRLATLARLFRSSTVPCHRALADARATVDVLHALLGRLGNLGVQSWEELRTFTAMVSPTQARKRHLADPLPHAPGVYLFRDGQGRVLYAGKSRDLRSRVRNYFVASEPRGRMAEMVGLADRVDAIVCAHEIEAEVRELRLIAAHKPRYNRRSRFPERAVWVKLTNEPFPRLSVVRRILADGADYLGPFGSARAAEHAIAAVHDVVPLRQCATRISTRRPRPACALAGMGRCGAPCEGRESREEYAVHAAAVREMVRADPQPLIEAVLRRLAKLAAQERYEEAASHRDRVAAFLRATARGQRLAALAGCPQIVAARLRDDNGWDLAVIRHGRLAAAGMAAPGVPPRPHIEALIATAETVECGLGPTPAASAEEMDCVLRWLESGRTRLVAVDGIWSLPARGAGRFTAWLGQPGWRESVRPLEDRRRLRPHHRPARATG